MQVANVEMAAAWDGAEGEHFSEHAARYDRASRRHAARLLEAAAPEPGMEVLEIGCGTGTTALVVASSVDPGSVLGVDLSSRMLEVARTKAATSGVTNLRLEQADAQVHVFEPASFDLAISSFGAMFFNDPIAAFTNIATGLRPGARLVLLAWRSLEDNEWLTEIRSALAVGRELPRPPANIPGPFGLAGEGHIRSVLTAAGYTDIELRRVDEPIDFGEDLDEAVAFLETFGITRGLTQGLDDTARTAALTALQDTAARHTTPDGVLFGSAAWLITARCPNIATKELT
ncbi:MAG: class I SAM-dependent methyltransferase [Acidimicrobiales bacterium]